MTVGFHSLLPPIRSGVADYAAALLAVLQERGEVMPNPSKPAGVELYHLGNNQLHRSIYQRALEHPGIVVLHDAVLQHFFLGWLNENAYVEEFVFNYGDWSRDLARSLWVNRRRSAQDPRYFRYRMLRRIAEASLGVVVHNPGAAAAVREQAPQARLFEIPHLFSPPELPPAYEVIRLRASFGLPAGAVLFGIFGHLRESKRLMPVLRAAERLRSRGANISLLVVGAFASPDLERAVRPLLEASGVAVTGYVSETEFWCYAAAVDACINLRYPAAGESSGISARLMGIGKPVIVTRSEETARIPEPACLKVDAGPAEQCMLEHHMALLAGSLAARVEIGARAASHTFSEHDARRCAAQYWEALWQAHELLSSR